MEGNQPKSLEDVARRMAPGELTAEGFLGDDERSVERIVAVDRLALARLGIPPEALGRRLAALTAVALSRLGGEIGFDGLRLTTSEGRGLMPCPYGDEGLHAKAMISAEKGGKSFRWSALSAHLADSHGFYGGRGSPFRLDPVALAKFLGLA